MKYTEYTILLLSNIVANLLPPKTNGGIVLKQPGGGTQMRIKQIWAILCFAILSLYNAHAAAIAEQTVSAEQKTKTGAIVGGVGVVGGAVGDLIINRDNN